MTDLRTLLEAGADAPGQADETADLARLTAALSSRALLEGTLDVRHRTVDSPVGTLLVAATPRGVARVAFAHEGFDAVVDDLARRLGPRVLPAGSTLDDVARELDDFFAGRRDHFDVAADLALARGFRRDVLDRLREIPYGATRSYAGVAAAAGSPGAVRAVGTACATNPVPILVPCHRVVRSDGTSGAYRGGAEAKQWLLAMESAAATPADRHTGP